MKLERLTPLGVRESIRLQHIDLSIMAEDIELLGLLQEECAEVIQIASKIRRFGIESYNPYIGETTTNRILLEREIADILAIVSLLCSRGMISPARIAANVATKMAALVRLKVLDKVGDQFDSFVNGLRNG